MPVAFIEVPCVAVTVQVPSLLAFTTAPCRTHIDPFGKAYEVFPKGEVISDTELIKLKLPLIEGVGFVVMVNEPLDPPPPPPPDTGVPGVTEIDLVDSRPLPCKL